MTEPARKRATYDDLYTIPKNMVGEIIDGDIVASPRPSRKHGYSASIIGNELGPPYNMGRGGPGGWIIIGEPEISFGDNILVPDLAGWKKERFPESEDHNWISISPDWVCEIISQGSIRIDRVEKMGIYVQHMVSYFWIIDPSNKTFEALKNEAGRWLIIGTYAEDDKVRAEPFQEIEIDLNCLWLENSLAVVKEGTKTNSL